MIEEDVFLDTEIWEQAEFLMDEGDACRLRIARRLRREFRAGELNAAPVALVDAAEDIHGGRLAGAVLADQAEHVAGLQLEANISQYRNAKKALIEVLDAKQRFGHRQPLTIMRWRNASVTAAKRMTPPLMA